MSNIQVELNINAKIDALIARDYPTIDVVQLEEAAQNWESTCEAYGVEQWTDEGVAIFGVCIGAAIAQ